MLKVGDTAPDFTVKTHTGEDLTLSSLKGKKVLLWFYPKANTSG
jgi:peroxiredoxin Q/BCP